MKVKCPKEELTNKLKGVQCCWSHHFPALSRTNMWFTLTLSGQEAAQNSSGLLLFPVSRKLLFVGTDAVNWAKFLVRGGEKVNFPGDDEAWRKSFHLKTLFHLLVAGRNIKLLDFAFPFQLPRSHLNVSSHQRRFKKALRSTKRDYLIPPIISVMNALSIGERFLPIQFKFALGQHFKWKPENEMKIYFDNAYSTKRWPMECIWQSNGTKVLSKWKVGRE